MSIIEAATPTSIQLAWESQTKQRPVRVHSSFAPFATMLRGPWVPASCKPWLAQSVPATKPDAQKAYQSGKCCKNTLCSFFAASWIRHRKRCISAARRKGECRLLVGADALAIPCIQDAIALLQQEGWQVRAAIFANPRRVQNKKWRALMKEYNIEFRPVERQSGFSDSNDQAINSELRKLMALPGSTCLGLLVNGDSDFASVLGDVVAIGREIIVIIPDTGRPSSVNAYRQAAAKVFLLPVKQDPCKVRATLLATGEGKVQLCNGDGKIPLASQIDADRACDALMDLGYYTTNSFLPTCIVKCWVESSLGPLCVYPRNFAIYAFCRHLSQRGLGDLRPKRKESCFALPLYGTSRPNHFIEEYGSGYAGNVWNGGGPFRLHDSADLTFRVLTRLGYINRWNTDANEAMFVFCSSTLNKRMLRKLFLLPEAGDSSGDVSAKMREGFLSNNTAGTWQLGPKDKDVRSLLQKEGLLQTASASKSDCLQAMQQYAARQGMPSMKNYDSYVSWILTSLSRNDPHRREILKSPF
jgi:hypothetical protein